MSICEWRRMTRCGALTALLGLLAACSSPGVYGFAPMYSPLPAEDEATNGSVPFDPSAARRKPDAWRDRRVVAFGVVVESAEGETPGSRRVLLSMRGLQPRNLCDGPSDDTCRVTVTDTEFSKVWAELSSATVLPVRTPPDPIQPGSLLRVVGNLQPASDELPLIKANFARHWPFQMYVTTAARESMRR